jgi:hypothetical protein
MKFKEGGKVVATVSASGDRLYLGTVRDCVSIFDKNYYKVVDTDQFTTYRVEEELTPATPFVLAVLGLDAEDGALKRRE